MGKTCSKPPTIFETSINTPPMNFVASKRRPPPMFILPSERKPDGRLIVAFANGFF
jgi:hypothetical protein